MEGKDIICKAAVAWKAKEPLVIEQVTVSPPKAGEVRIRIHATSVCHTDAYTLGGHDAEGVFPCILGHEGAGVVESVGAGVDSIAVGDHVVPLYIPECRQCKMCTSGKTNLCSVVRTTQGRGVMPDGTTRFSCRGEPVFHYMGTSTFAQYTVVLEISCAKIPAATPLNRACLLGCGIPTGFGAVRFTAQVEPGAVMAVFGCGAIGLSVIQGAVAARAGRIIALDMQPARLALARSFGATDTINPADFPDQRIQDLIVQRFDGGVDYSFECSGGSVDVMRAALESCHKGWGQSVIISVAPSGAEVSVRPFMLVTGRVWRGSAFGGVKGRSQLPDFAQWYLDGSLKIDEYVTHKFSLAQINDAFDQMHAGDCIRPEIPMI